MPVTADRTACVGSGTCVTVAPHTFDQDEDGTVVVLQPEPAEGDRAQVRAAVELCPVHALTV